MPKSSTEPSQPTELDVAHSTAVQPDHPPTETQLNGNASSALSGQADTKAIQPKTISRKRQWFAAVGAVTLALGTAIGWHWWQFQQAHASTDNAQIKGHPSPIAPKITATVQQILVKDGDYVKAGQPLIVLEDQDLTLKVQQAEANLAAAKAQLESAIHTVPMTSQTNLAQVQQSQASLTASRSNVVAAQASVAQAQAKVRTDQAKVAQAQTNLNKNQTDLRRYEVLSQQGAIATQQLDTARASFETAQADLAAAQQTVAEAQAEVSSAQAQLQQALAQAEASKGQLAETRVSGQQVVVKQDEKNQAEAQVKQAAANLALARQQMQYRVIKAPINGYIGNLTAQVGQRAQADQPLLSLVPLQLDQIYVEANFKETSIKDLRIGESADVEVDAYPGEIFRATIAGISPATGADFALLPPDNATGNFNKVVQWVPVRLAFRPDADPEHKLRAGLSVKVTVNTVANPNSSQP